MDEIDFDKLADDWIAEWAERIESDNSSSENPAIDVVSDFDLDDMHEQLWRFVQSCYKKEMSPRVWAVLAAGPVEDLLAHYGPGYIDRVEDLAGKDPKFRDLLGGVWRNAMTDDVWDRVTRTRDGVW